MTIPLAELYLQSALQNVPQTMPYKTKTFSAIDIIEGRVANKDPEQKMVVVIYTGSHSPLYAVRGGKYKLYQVFAAQLLELVAKVQ